MLLRTRSSFQALNDLKLQTGVGNMGLMSHSDASLTRLLLRPACYPWASTNEGNGGTMVQKVCQLEETVSSVCGAGTPRTALFTRTSSSDTAFVFSVLKRTHYFLSELTCFDSSCCYDLFYSQAALQEKDKYWRDEPHSCLCKKFILAWKLVILLKKVL